MIEDLGGSKHVKTIGICPFCLSATIRLIEMTGVGGTLKVFQCDHCTKQWNESSSTRQRPNDIPEYSPPGKPNK